MATKRQVKKQANKLDTTKAKETVAKVSQAVEETAEKATQAAKETAEKATQAVKETAAKAAQVVEEKTTETKAAVKQVKKPAVKKEIKTTLVVEHQGKQVDDKTMIAAVKKAWTKSGKKVGDIKTMTLYVKPEESAVYYVINTTDTGSVEF